LKKEGAKILSKFLAIKNSIETLDIS